jgi:nicotinate-nucleotide pyrophosphorylase (carboxylating)
MPVLSLAVERLVDLALEEDLLLGDATSQATLEPEAVGAGRFLAKEELILAGTAVAARVFKGPLMALLGAERTALNFLQRLSGVATATHRCVRALAEGGSHTRLLDTRKTTPGWRLLEKDAVRAGGGTNHRFALGDGILIKDNHVVACGGVAEAVRRARAGANALLKIEVEVEDLAGLDAAISAGADVVLLDNMDDGQLVQAVARAAGRVLLEASGNITEARLSAVAGSGVDYVSMGAITHSARAVDISFEVV